MWVWGKCVWGGGGKYRLQSDHLDAMWLTLHVSVGRRVGGGRGGGHDRCCSHREYYPCVPFSLWPSHSPNVRPPPCTGAALSDHSLPLTQELHKRLHAYYEAADEGGTPTGGEGALAITFEDALPTEDFFEVCVWGGESGGRKREERWGGRSESNTEWRTDIGCALAPVTLPTPSPHTHTRAPSQVVDQHFDIRLFPPLPNV